MCSLLSVAVKAGWVIRVLSGKWTTVWEKGKPQTGAIVPLPGKQERDFCSQPDELWKKKTQDKNLSTRESKMYGTGLPIRSLGNHREAIPKKSAPSEDNQGIYLKCESSNAEIRGILKI